MSEFLDELARSMAKPMPRSRVLRLIGGAVVAAAVPGIATTTKARAASRFHTCERDGGRLCECNCKGDICQRICCIPKEAYECKCGTVAEGAGCRCINPCGGEGGPCCNPTTQDCVGNRATARCLPKCKQNEERCDSACCATNEECDRIRVGARSVGQCVPKCPQGRARCGPGRCCPPKWYCHNRNTGLCKKCPPGTEECGTKCCRKSQRCCGHDLCCQHGRDCCTVGGKRTCCAVNTKCAPQILSGNIGVTKGSPHVCCPKPRYVVKQRICCPPGKIALNGEGQRVGPGLEPFCCANDQVCRSGSSFTCCQKSNLLGSETCCSGRCVDLQSDPNNCGSCGNVCASGVCGQGICALP